MWFIFFKIKTSFHDILWNSLCSFLLYKQLPNKVKLLSLILNIYFIGLQLLVKESYT